MSLIGETAGRPSGDRFPIHIALGTRAALRDLLFEPEMRGVGYTEFLDRAIAQAWREIEAEREGRRWP